MAQNISLLGATYSAVPAVQLPKSGGGTATFTDVTDTTATAADVATGTYFYTANGTRTAGTAAGGGAPLATGSFTAGTAGTTQTINIPYTGSGYPIMLGIVVKNGVGNATPYKSTLLKNNIGSYALIKYNYSMTPSYYTSQASNAGIDCVYYRTGSTSVGKEAFYGNRYTPTVPSSTQPLTVHSNTSFEIYISSASGTLGFYPGQQYDYWVVYSA